MSDKWVRIERSGPVATVTLDRVEKRNALSHALQSEIASVAESFRHDRDTRVVIFTGAGPHFSAGADLADRDAPPTPDKLSRLRASQAGPRMLRAILEIDQITIAAINGVAAGGGACITTACDFRIGAADCRVSYPEVPLGMSLSWNALPLCVHLIGPARAKRMIMLGQQEDAQTLLDWGFLDEVVDAADLQRAAQELAGRYAALPPIPTQMVKKSVNMVSQALDRAVMHMDMDQLLLTHLTDDFREGVGAWFERRSPTFKGD
jgi:enoyl-CoA hydratase